MTQAPATPELVERLRDLTRFMTGTPRSRAMLDAADALEAQHARIAELEAESAALTRALTGLTCSGSEFFIRKGDRYVADIDACVSWVRRTKEDAHRRTVKAITEQKASQALADRYEKALDLALDVAIGQERRLIKYGKPANELAWLIEQIRQALSSDAILNLAPVGGRGEGWRPIETAPKDGTKVIGLRKSGRAVTAYCAEYHAGWVAKEGGGHVPNGEFHKLWTEDQGDSVFPVTLTHWMPLPPPPQEQKEGSSRADLSPASRSPTRNPAGLVCDDCGETFGTLIDGLCGACDFDRLEGMIEDRDRG